MKRFYYPIHLRDKKTYDKFLMRLNLLRKQIVQATGEEINKTDILLKIIGEGFSRYESDPESFKK